MAQIGRKIFYLLSNGNVILTTSELSGSVQETTIDQDFMSYTALQSYQQSGVGVLQLNFGDYAQNFATYPFHVDVTQNPPQIAWDTSALIGTTLDDVKAVKIAQLEDFYNQDVTAGFKSSALGTEHTYPSDSEAQDNIQIVIKRLEIAEKQAIVAGVDLSVQANRPTFDYLTLDAGPLAHNLDQIEQAFADGVDAAAPALEKLRTLRDQAKNATTPDAVNAIIW